MIRLKVNSGKVLNNIDKRVIPSRYVPKKIAELVKDYPDDMQTDFRDYLDLSGNTTIDPNTVELDEQSGCLILTSKTREGFQYTTDELIQIVQDWLADSFEYGASNSLMASSLMAIGVLVGTASTLGLNPRVLIRTSPWATICNPFALLIRASTLVVAIPPMASLAATITLMRSRLSTRPIKPPTSALTVATRRV